MGETKTNGRNKFIEKAWVKRLIKVASATGNVLSTVASICIFITRTIIGVMFQSIVWALSIPAILVLGPLDFVEVISDDYCYFDDD